MLLQQWNHVPIVVNDVWNVAIQCAMWPRAVYKWLSSIPIVAGQCVMSWERLLSVVCVMFWLCALTSLIARRMAVIRCHWCCIIAVIIWPRTIQTGRTPVWWQHKCLGALRELLSSALFSLDDDPSIVVTAWSQPSHSQPGHWLLLQSAPVVSWWSSAWLTFETLQWCKCDYK